MSTQLGHPFGNDLIACRAGFWLWVGYVNGKNGRLVPSCLYTGLYRTSLSFWVSSR